MSAKYVVWETDRQTEKHTHVVLHFRAVLFTRRSGESQSASITQCNNASTVHAVRSKVSHLQYLRSLLVSNQKVLHNNSGLMWIQCYYNDFLSATYDKKTLYVPDDDQSSASVLDKDDTSDAHSAASNIVQQFLVALDTKIKKNNLLFSLRIDTFCGYFGVFNMQQQFLVAEMSAIKTGRRLFSYMRLNRPLILLYWLHGWASPATPDQTACPFRRSPPLPGWPFPWQPRGRSRLSHTEPQQPEPKRNRTHFEKETTHMY